MQWTESTAIVRCWPKRGPCGPCGRAVESVLTHRHNIALSNLFDEYDGKLVLLYINNIDKRLFITLCCIERKNDVLVVVGVCGLACGVWGAWGEVLSASDKE